MLTILKETIRDEGLFDLKNSAIILCNPELGAALGRQALSVTQIR